MNSKAVKPKNITQYIKAAPKEAKVKLHQMLACVRLATPGARESLKWGMPAFSYKRILVIFGGFKHHIGFYPTVAAMKPFTGSLSKFKTAKGSIQFPLNKPLPVALIRKITALRVAQSIKKDGKWRS